jgi:hypothetical protein
VIILILESACLSYASQFELNRDEALEKAYSQYKASNIYNKVAQQFVAPAKEYSILQLKGFILRHHL